MNLARKLVRTWAKQGREGFLLSGDSGQIETKLTDKCRCGVRFRFRWLPHREVRTDVAELERRGILNPHRDESSLFRDSRDPHGRFCFLCERNIRECNPLERLVPVTLADRDYLAGANFAWIEPNHFTVMAREHTDQSYSRNALRAMLELHNRTDGRFRVLFNGDGVGATIPWHLHYQITTEEFPVESLGNPAEYPTAVCRFAVSDEQAADSVAQEWIARDPENHGVNMFVSPAGVFVFPRDRRKAKATNKSLVGGFEVAGDFAMSAPIDRPAFDEATTEVARDILSQVKPCGLG